MLVMLRISAPASFHAWSIGSNRSCRRNWSGSPLTALQTHVVVLVTVGRKNGLGDEVVGAVLDDGRVGAVHHAEVLATRHGVQSCCDVVCLTSVSRSLKKRMKADDCLISPHDDG
jgi:hypothetical protein